MDLQAGATDVLARLIRFDTVNPAGNERACQEWLKGYLEDAGLECELLCAEDPERPNLIARLRGEAEGPALGYLSHVDTVLADPGDWKVDPWSGETRDGFVWGRGALDMKSQTAAEAVAAATPAREGGRRGPGAIRRPPALPRVLRREGHVQVHGPDARQGGARRDPRLRRQRAAQ